MWRNLRKAISTYSAYAGDHDDLLRGLCKAQPEAMLDEFVEGSDRDRTRNEDRLSERVRCLQSLKLVAAISSVQYDKVVGTVVDIQAREVLAAYDNRRLTHWRCVTRWHPAFLPFAAAPPTGGREENLQGPVCRVLPADSPLRASETACSTPPSYGQRRAGRRTCSMLPPGIQPDPIRAGLRPKYALPSVLLPQCQRTDSPTSDTQPFNLLGSNT